MKTINWLLIIGLAIALGACQGSIESKEGGSVKIEVDSDGDGNSTVNIETKDLQDAMNQVEKALKDVEITNNGEKVEVISFRDLQTLLPEKLNGYKRISKGGETAGVMGMDISHAEAKYEKGSDQFNIEVVDTGGMGMALLGMAAWSKVTVDREDENGYERTTTKGDNKYYEKFEKNGISKIAMIGENRFIVTVEGKIDSENDMDALREIVEDINIDDLK